MLKVTGEHKYLMKYLYEDENTIVGELINQCPNHRYKKKYNRWEYYDIR